MITFCTEYLSYVTDLSRPQSVHGMIKHFLDLLSPQSHHVDS